MKATTTMSETTVTTTTPEATAAVQTSTLGLHPLEEYEPFVGAAVIERILKKAEPLRTLHLDISARHFTEAA
jgi:hypothetical protein